MKKTIFLLHFLMNFPLLAIDAPSSWVPTGFVNGDTFFVIFNTATTFDACASTSTQIDEFVTSTVANGGGDAAGITGWTGLYAHEDSTNKMDASEAFGNVTDRPIYKVDGTLVGNDRADILDGTLLSVVDMDQNGNTLAAQDVSTGLGSNGAANTTLGAGGVCLLGINTATNGSWLSNNPVNNPGAESLYVLSPLLTTDLVSPPSLSNLTATLEGEVNSRIVSITIQGQTVDVVDGKFTIDVNIPDTETKIDVVLLADNGLSVISKLVLGKK